MRVLGRSTRVGLERDAGGAGGSHGNLIDAGGADNRQGIAVCVEVGHFHPGQRDRAAVARNRRVGGHRAVGQVERDRPGGAGEVHDVAAARVAAVDDGGVVEQRTVRLNWSSPSRPRNSRTLTPGAVMGNVV